MVANSERNCTVVMQVWQAVKERLNGQSRSVGIARGWSSMSMAWRHLKLRSVRRALENAGKASDSLLVRPVRQKMKAIEMAFDLEKEQRYKL